MSVVKNSALNLVLTISSVLFPFLIIPYVTRVLAVNELGKVMYADAISQYLIIIAALGIPFYGVREIAKLSAQKEKISNIVLELIIIQFSISVVSCIALWFIVPHLGVLLDKRLLVLCSIFVISNSFLIEWFYQGIQDFKYITIRSVIIKILSLILIVLLVKGSNDGYIYYAILSGLALLNSALNIYRFSKIGFVKVRKLDLRRHFAPLIVTFGINFSISIYAILDTLILGYFSGEESVGYYTISLKIVKTFWVIINAFGIVLISHTAKLIKEDKMAEVQQNISKALNIILTFSIPFIIICQLFPVQILVIIGGSKYVNSVELLRILSFLPLIIGICNVYGTQFLMVYNKEKYVFIATLVALVFSVAINFMLVPHLKEIGTGIASVTAELVVCGIIVYYSNFFLKIFFDFKYLLQIIVSSLTMIVFWVILKSFLFGFPLMFCCCLLFVVSFVALQMFYFKHSFIFFVIGKLQLLVKK